MKSFKQKKAHTPYGDFLKLLTSNVTVVSFYSNTLPSYRLNTWFHYVTLSVTYCDHTINPFCAVFRAIRFSIQNTQPCHRIVVIGPTSWNGKHPGSSCECSETLLLTSQRTLLPPRAFLSYMQCFYFLLTIWVDLCSFMLTDRTGIIWISRSSCF